MGRGHPCDGRADALPASAFTPHSYRHDPRTAHYGLEAAEKLGLEPERVFKTLLAEVDGRSSSAIVPVTGSSTSRRSARAVGGKRAEMADPAVARAQDRLRRGRHQPDRAEDAASDRARRDRRALRHGVRVGRPPRPRRRARARRPARRDRRPLRADTPGR